MRMHHVGIQVPDLEAAIDWYVAALGTRMVRRGAYGGHPLAFLALPGGLVELVEEPPEAAASGVVSHLALVVDDLDSSVNRLLALGAALQEGPVQVAGVGRTAFVAGPHGEWLELLQTDAQEDSPSR